MEFFTKANMAAHHNLVQDLVSEVTFGKVERMIQVTYGRVQCAQHVI